MILTDYLLDQTGVDWRALLRPWSWRLPQTYTLCLVNRFAEPFVALADGSVHTLRGDNGRLVRLAGSETSFNQLLQQPAHADDWLMIPLVDQLVTARLTLGYGQCYGFKVPPALGGAYATENVAVFTLHERIAFLADIYRQLKDVPSGTPVVIKFTNA